MPCRSDYLEPTNAEVDASKVLAMLEELKTGKLPEYYGDGAYNGVYNKDAKGILEKKVPELCSKLQEVSDVSKYSLEMQMWWRDHQEADRKRLAKELQEQKDAEAKAKAVAKLTPYERELLGL